MWSGVEISPVSAGHDGTKGDTFFAKPLWGCSLEIQFGRHATSMFLL